MTNQTPLARRRLRTWLRLLRLTRHSENQLREYLRINHATTLPLTLWAAETEAYLANLTDTIPSVYVVLREDTGDAPFDVVLVTASTYEAQDYADSSEEIVEKVPMPDGLIAWVRDFVQEYHQHEDFVKRRRDRHRVDLVEDGKGDVRIRQMSDVYRAPKRVMPKRVIQ